MGKPLKIGVFDSGVGGITVLSELKKNLNFSDFVYLGDTAHVPYGTKSPVQIEKLSLDCAKTMKNKKVDALVVACNTASSLALPAIQNEMGSIPVLGVVEPGATAALTALFEQADEKSRGPVLVLATRATVNSHAYLNRLKHLAPQVSVIEQSCPLLVPMIEEGWVDHPILYLTLNEYVQGHLVHALPGVALLGCTHYPWIQAAVVQAMPGWKVVNSARAVTDSLLQNPIIQNGLDSTLSQKSSGHASGKIEWIFTDPDAVPAFARQFISAIH